jgi:transcriptional regulator with XRE-family HTH domain
MANALKLERVRRDLTQVDLAALTGDKVPQYRLSLLERGVRPRPDEAEALSEVLGLASRDLFPELSEEVRG